MGHPKKRKKARRLPRRSETGWSISGWCKHRGVGRTTFYAMELEGRAPKVHRPNGPRGWAEITIEADAIWSAGNPSTTSTSVASTE
jgi:hypothetical protein